MLVGQLLYTINIVRQEGTVSDGPEELAQFVFGVSCPHHDSVSPGELGVDAVEEGLMNTAQRPIHLSDTLAQLVGQ